jgi:hypothetical protein
MTTSLDVASALTSSPSGPRAVRAPRGATISCRGWEQEAALRMLMNNLDAEVAERPDDLVVYGGTGRAARSWDAFDAIVRTLRTLANDETLLVQSGKPVAVFRTHADAPRVLIANANLVGRWANWDDFRRLERLGLTMYGQMTAGSWIYIGSQGIVQGTYETFGAVAQRHFGGTLAGKLVVTAGLGGMGGAQPLAAAMHGAAVLGIEVDPTRIAKRIETRYCDKSTASLDEALVWLRDAQAKGVGLSVALLGNAAEVLPELVRRGVTPDVLTDQTSAHDMLVGYLPIGYSLESAAALRATDPEITFVPSHSMPASMTRFVFPVSCRSTFARCSARGRGPSGGRRSPAIPRTSIAPTIWCWRCSRTMNRCGGGSRWRENVSRFKDCPRASAGSVRGIARDSRSRSTSSSRAARSLRRLSSGVIISTPAAWPPRSARRKACAMGRTPSRIGPFSTRCSTSRAARRGCPFTTVAAWVLATRCTPDK